MSFDTNRTYRYQLNGRKLQLYQYVQSANTDTVAGYRIKLPLDYYANQLIYPKCFLSMQFSKIAKTKTLSIQNLKDIKLMGFEIEIVNNDNEILSKYY